MYIIAAVIFLPWLVCLIKYPKYYKRVRNTYLTLFAAIIVLVAITFVQQARHMKERARTSDANVNLNRLFVACQSYWKENGGDKVCNIGIASQKEYGFIQSGEVIIEGQGTAKTFAATARHVNSEQTHSVDAKGNFSYFSLLNSASSS